MLRILHSTIPHIRGRNNRTVAQRYERHIDIVGAVGSIPTSPTKMKKIDWLDKNKLETAAQRSFSMLEFLRTLGLATTGSNANTAKKYLRKHNISTSHFNGNRHLKPNRMTLDQILVERSTFKDLTRLKRRLIKEGLLISRCYKCKNDGTWMGMPLTLQLEHKNGINNDHRLENLELLCPNCHSQTPTWGGKNRANAR